MICIVFMRVSDVTYIFLYILEIPIKYKKGMKKINYVGIAVYKNTLNK